VNLLTASIALARARRSAGIVSTVVLAASGCSSGVAVTGATDATSIGTQTETAATTSFFGGVHRIVVSYNDESSTQATILYGPSTRQILRGASLGGWSYSEDHGATWKYGGKLKPPPGWAGLWGDPAITTSRSSYGTVFVSNLAFPDAKFPSGGVNGWVDGSIAGGACLFRSPNGGVDFKFFQCLTDTTPVPGSPFSSRGHFYDGGSLAAGPGGEIYAAYVDLDTSQIVVYRSPDGAAPFVPIPPPVPDYYVGTHPRIQVGPDGVLFAMTAAKQRSGPNPQYMLVVNRFLNGAWASPTLITPAEVTPEVDLGSSLLGFKLTVRTGPQFSFDIGTRSDVWDDSVRFLVTQRNDAGWLFVRGGVCDYALSSCGWLTGWAFGADRVTGREAQRVDVFNPDVVAFPGFLFGIAPRWQGSFLTRYGTSTTTLNLTRATLGYVDGKPFSIPVDIGRDQPVCSDQRGYWGDYDAHVVAGVAGNSVRFMRFMTDSSRGCTERWFFVGKHQHVRAFSYEY
jgi:hypothetical protein